MGRRGGKGRWGEGEGGEVKEEGRGGREGGRGEGGTEGERRLDEVPALSEGDKTN